MPVEGGEADAEMVGVGIAEFGDIVGDGAAGLGGKIRMTGGEEPQQGRLRGGPGRGLGGGCGWCWFHRLPLCSAIMARATGWRRRRTSLEDGEDLSFGTHIVETDQDCF